jgi:hypothetical protein
LKCGNCGKTWKYSNDRTDRVHIMKSAAKEELLRKRRARERVKRGVDPDGGRKHHTNRKGHGIKLQNLQRVAAAILNGCSYRQYANEAVLAGDLLVDSRTWERHAIAVWDATERAGKRTMDKYIVRLCDSVQRNGGSGISLSADGAWNKRREANQHCLALLHNGVPILLITPQKSVLGEKDGKECVVRQGDYEGSSKGMEAAAWAQVAEALDAIDKRFRNLVRAVCVDRDASVTEAMRVCLAALFLFISALFLLYFCFISVYFCFYFCFIAALFLLYFCFICVVPSGRSHSP